MDREHGRLQARPDHGTAGDEPRLADSCLLTDLLTGSPEGGFFPLDVSGDPGPLAAERPDPLPPKDDEDPPFVPEERGHHRPLRDLGQDYGPGVPVHDEPVSRREDRHVDPVDKRDAAEDRARRDDRFRPSVHNRRGSSPPLREAVHHVRAHRAPLAVGECEDATRHALPPNVRGGVNDRPRLPVDAS